MWMGPGPPNLFYLHIRLLTRLFFNPYTVHSDVGGTEPVFWNRDREPDPDPHQKFMDPQHCWQPYFV
jgi:hypothetical protein